MLMSPTPTNIVPLSEAQKKAAPPDMPGPKPTAPVGRGMPPSTGGPGARPASPPPAGRAGGPGPAPTPAGRAAPPNANAPRPGPGAGGAPPPAGRGRGAPVRLPTLFASSFVLYDSLLGNWRSAQKRGE